MSATPAAELQEGYTLRHWFAAVFLIIAYIGAYQFAALFSFYPILLHVPSAIALTTLFFFGIRLWPAVVLAALVAGVSVNAALPALILIPLGEMLQAAVGAHALRGLGFDPIFRRFRDMLTFILTAFAVSTILPTAAFLVAIVTDQTSGDYGELIAEWGLYYTAVVTALLVLTPFMLRWFSKRRFNRNAFEIIEIVVAFSFLLAINYFLIVPEISTVAGVPLVYFLFIPLFWIALRLRPRFVTLAFVVLGVTYVGTALGAPDAASLLYRIEGFLIVTAVICYLIVALEEDRRRSANLLRTQLSTLENAIARISSESKAKNDFIAVLAHELRNPLAPIVSGIDLLKLKENRDPEELETLTIMEDRMHMVRRLLDDLLDISRITENKMVLQSERVMIDEVVRRAIVSTEHHLQERHQILSYNISDKSLMVLGDAARLEQVFSNLLTNASKYSDPGDDIALTVRKSDEHVEITVRERGIGIEPKVLDTIFVPFHQIESGTRTIKGLGIGLALVRSFVEMHGGAVAASSKGAGHGSEFTVLLPLMHEDGIRKLTVKDSTPDRTDHGSSRKHILVVDDNDIAASSIGKLLEIQGYKVSYAFDGGQAIDRVKSSSPDIVLLDLDLPDRDGYSVARILRERGYTGHLVALTGLSTQDARLRGQEAGFKEYLVKPVALDELRRTLAKLA